MDQAGATAPVVVVHLWGVPASRVPVALARMAWNRGPLRRSGCSFYRLLGTARAGGFGVRDADLRHWALLTCWPDGHTAVAFEASRTVAGWDRIADERLRLLLRPLSNRGRWGGREPFGRSAPESSDEGPVAALTRARIRPGRSRAFRQAVPAVAADLAGARGLRLAVGIGESPIGLQGTLSMWDDARSLADFAYRGRAHAEVVRRTPHERWYTEELFARFAVVHAEGRYGGRARG